MNHARGDGPNLFHRVDGAAGAPWLVLSNSLASDHTMWDPQMPLLTQRFRVLRYDTRGHGQSDAPPGPYSFAMLVEDVLRLMDRHGIGRATFMGLSLGGMTGLGLAIHHPDRVERFVCCGARADAPESYAGAWRDRLALVEREGMRAVLQTTVERWLAPSFRAARPDVVGRIERMILSTSLTGYRGCVEALKGLSYGADLPRIEAPTLFVVGAEDTGTPPDAMRAMADRVPGARLAIIPDGAHLPNLDNSAAFNAAVVGFLGLPGGEPASA